MSAATRFVDPSIRRAYSKSGARDTEQRADARVLCTAVDCKTEVLLAQPLSPAAGPLRKEAREHPHSSSSDLGLSPLRSPPDLGSSPLSPHPDLDPTPLHSPPELGSSPLPPHRDLD